MLGGVDLELEALATIPAKLSPQTPRVLELLRLKLEGLNLDFRAAAAV